MFAMTENIKPAVYVKEDQVYANSRDVSAFFGKRHADVLRKITDLEVSTDFNQRNFARVMFPDGKGEMRPSCDMTKDGFTFLVMGFTGAKASQFKEAYIKRFNEMEEHIKAQQPVAPQPAIPTNFAEALQLDTI